MRALINPANQPLSGTALAYFPRGGPVPRPPPAGLSASTSGWGGMDAGSGMLYPAQSVDGVVHTYGGNELREMLQAIASDGVDAAGQPVRCAVGRAVVTPSAGSLRDGFDRIAHTVPPFWSDAE